MVDTRYLGLKIPLQGLGSGVRGGGPCSISQFIVACGLVYQKKYINNKMRDYLSILIYHFISFQIKRIRKGGWSIL